MSGSTRTRLDRAIAFLAASPPAKEVLVVGPSRGAVDELVRAVLASRPEPGASLFGLHRKTFSGWAADLAAPRIAHEGATIATPLALEAVIKAAVERAIAGGRLGYFGRDTGAGAVARTPSFGRSALATLLELRGAGVEAPRLRGRNPRLDDLANLLEAYEEELLRRRLADHADVMREAKVAVTDSEVARSPLLLFDVPVRSACDSAFLSAAVSVAESVLGLVPRGDEAARMALQAAGIDVTGADGAPTTSLERARSYLFEAGAGELAERDATVELFSAPTEAQEAVEVARRIVASGAPYDDVAIVIPSRATYGAYIETALDRAGVPAFYSFGTRRPHPAGRALLALLACKLERYSARRFAEYLSLGEVPAAATAANTAPAYLPLHDDGLGRLGGGEPVSDPDEVVHDEESASRDRFGGLATPRQWEASGGDARGADESGAAYYARRLSAFRASKELEARALRREDPEAPRLRRIEADIDEAEALLRFAEPLLGLLDALPALADWEAWTVHLEAIARASLRRPEVVLAVLGELRALCHTGPVSLAEVADVLHVRLGELERPQPKRRYGRVFVGSPRDLRGRAFRVVFTLGLTERVFPERVREDPLLFDEDRRALDPSLATSDRAAEDHRLGLLLAVGGATERAVVSFPRADADAGRPRVPSFYALDFERAVRGALPAVDAMLDRALQHDGARLNWPAPVDRERAIDVLEHDLATLHALFAKSEKGGGARYLLDENAHLARALRARFSRFDLRRHMPSDGLVSPSPYVLRALAERSLKAKPHAPSSLQAYAACPLRFYLSTVLGLAPRREREVTDALDRATRGTLFHASITRFARALAAASMLPIPREKLSEALGMLREVFQDESERAASETEPTVRRIFESDKSELLEDLEELVRRDFVRGAPMTPAHVELSFGLARSEESDPASVAAPALLPRGYLLRGAIDSIEKSADGASLRVTDYKTGLPTAKGPLVTGGGEQLQPVLYGLAAEALVGVAFPSTSRVASSRLYFATRRAEFAERNVTLDADAQRRALDVLDAIEGAVTDGFFPAWPRADACKICDVRAACSSNEEARVYQKSMRVSVGRRHLEVLRDLRVAP